jgi:Domain of unknown function (DUF4388)
MAGSFKLGGTALALQGTLDTFSLPDVLRLLATTSKSGRLRIEGDRGRGSVWLADGGIVDADADRVIEGTPTDEVIFELLRFDSGQFAFDGDDTATAGGDREDVEAVLRRASSLLSEWTELENVVPSLEHEVCLAGDLSADEVTIDADRWRSLVAVSSGRTVGELATSLGLTELGVSRAVRELVDLGVADVEAPGTSDRSRSQAPADSRRPSVPHAGDGLGRPVSPTGEPQRAGWLTGETPAVPAEPPRPSPASNGRVRASLDDTVVSSSPPPPPPPAPSVPPAPAQVPAEPPAKGGFASRLGRGRGASARGDDATTTGSTPVVPGGTSVPTGRTPATPPARTNDSGRSRQNGADVASGSRRSPGSTRPASPEGPSRPVSPPSPSRALPPGDRGGPPVAPGGPARRPSTPPVSSPPASPSPFDGGRLGPAPASGDTGQIRPVTPSSLPPDLHWAADDTGTGDITGGGTMSSPFSGLSSLGPARPSPADPGEVAAHVAAMSPEARSAVQATVGNAGGSTGGRGGGQGEDIAQRGRLISFLSSVR